LAKKRRGDEEERKWFGRKRKDRGRSEGRSVVGTVLSCGRGTKLVSEKRGVKKRKGELKRETSHSDNRIGKKKKGLPAGIHGKENGGLQSGLLCHRKKKSQSPQWGKKKLRVVYNKKAEHSRFECAGVKRQKKRDK